jgi:hypothetical protein
MLSTFRLFRTLVPCYILEFEIKFVCRWLKTSNLEFFCANVLTAQALDVIRVVPW